VLTVTDGNLDAFGITVKKVSDGSVYYQYSQAVSFGDLLIVQ